MTIINNAQEFNALPIGSVLTDGDDWTHTKIQDAILDEGGDNTNGNTTNYLSPDGNDGTFGNCWDYQPLTLINVQEDTMTEATIIPGRKYRVIARKHGHNFDIGAIVEAKGGEDSEAFVGTDKSGREDATWFLRANEVEEVVPTRPTIDFSGPSRNTARVYATELLSRVNKPETNAVLQQVASGNEDVDAFNLAEALLDTMRRVATRFGQSTQRRVYGEKAAHLGYIVHGVLANVADNLPAYQQGERSRLLENAKDSLRVAQEQLDASTAHVLAEKARADGLAEEVKSLNRTASETIDSQREEIETLRVERGLLTQAASDERRRLVKEIDDNHAQAVAEGAELQAKLQVVEAERDAASAVIGYIVERLGDSEQQRVFGYWDGVKDATLPSDEG